MKPGCPHLTDTCEVAAGLSGVRTCPKPHPGLCVLCEHQDSPRGANWVTVSLGARGLEKCDPAKLTSFLAEYSSLIPFLGDPAIKEAWEGRLRVIRDGTGVGSQLWQLLESLGIRHSAGCSCLKLAERMNALGPAGCRRNRAELAADMQTNAAAYGWTTVATAAAKAIASGLAFRLSVTDLYGSLLGEAIRRAEMVPESVSPAPVSAVGKKTQKIILATNLCPGDVLTLTAAVESLHATYPGEYCTDVRTNHPLIWTANPHITPLAEGPDVRTIQMHYPAVHRCNQVASPFLAGYTAYLSEQIGRRLQLTTNRPHVYLTPDETKRPRSRLWQGAPDLTRPYWIVNAGIKSDFTVKQWPVEHYQAVIDLTRDKIQWVQIGLSMHDHPRLRGVISLLQDGPPMRQLILLARHAAGGLGPITFLQHLMAAWQRPYICLAGGREPPTWIQYPAQHTLHTIGQLDCCAVHSCWRGRVVPLNDGAESDQSLCAHPVTDLRRPVARCMQMIRPEEVIAILNRHCA